MSRLYRFVLVLGQKFFSVTGLPVPASLYRVHRSVRRRLGDNGRRDLAAEVEALALAVERLEARAYLDEVGRRDS